MNVNRLFIFNPDCEMAIANGSHYYMPPANITRMADDLAFLPAYLAGEDDGVWMKAQPNAAFMAEVMIPLEIKCRLIADNEDLLPVMRQPEPWGWSPKMCHWFSERGIVRKWEPDNKEWYSRKVARDGLLQLMQELSFIEKGLLPDVCSSLQELNALTCPETHYIAKAPWSSSGRGLLSFKGKPDKKMLEWLGGIINKQGYIMLEKRVDKEVDFAMEFYAGDDGITFVGWSLFATGEHGEYRGNYIGSQKELLSRLTAVYDDKELFQVREYVISVLRHLLPSYRGYLGVDMMIYRNERGERRIHPCLEINLRYNMGIVAYALSCNYLAEGTEGIFDICFYSRPREALTVCNRAKQEDPIVYKNNRILSGYLNLTPVTETTCFVASVRCY